MVGPHHCRHHNHSSTARPRGLSHGSSGRERHTCTCACAAAHRAATWGTHRGGLRLLDGLQAALLLVLGDTLLLGVGEPREWVGVSHGSAVERQEGTWRRAASLQPRAAVCTGTYDAQRHHTTNRHTPGEEWYLGNDKLWVTRAQTRLLALTRGCFHRTACEDQGKRSVIGAKGNFVHTRESEETVLAVFSADFCVSQPSGAHFFDACAAALDTHHSPTCFDFVVFLDTLYS